MARLGFTARSWSSPEPLGHALSSRRHGPGRARVRAVCGVALERSTDPHLRRRRFEPAHPRACPNCRRAVVAWDLAAAGMVDRPPLCRGTS